MQRIITLTSDFGYRDPYVAAMKGVMVHIAPDARFVDITHGISAQDIAEAAFVLRQSCPFFPRKSIHLVVIDPGVGTERLPVGLEYKGQFYIGPDNGLFPLLMGEESADRIVALDKKEYWRTGEPSTTFHGRDVFAPVAGHLARGVALRDVGTPLRKLQPLRWGMPISDESGVRGWIIHIDHFGNCISNIPQSLLEKYAAGNDVTCYVGSTIINGIHNTYGDVDQQEPVVLFGSSGFLEVAINGGDAHQLLSIKKGDPVNVIFADARRRHATRRKAGLR